MRFLSYLFCACIVFIYGHAELAWAKKQHALAMHGAPKYSADFTNLDYANPDAPKSGVLKEAVAGSYDSLNHHVIKGTPAKGLALTNDKLMARVWDEAFTLYGLVAESIEIPEDRSWIIFHLNPKARFHDGKSMTVEDVIFSYEMYRKHGHPVRRRVYGFVDKVTKLSDLSVRFDFGEGYDAETALILAMMPVLPKHYWKGRDFSETTLEPPLGSGPYKIKTAEQGRQIVYERVPDYWAKDLPVNKGHYNFETIFYDYYRDTDIALEALKAGDVNFRREWDVTTWKSGYDFPAVEKKSIILEELAHNRPERVRSLVFNTRRSLFQDRRVREALSYAFDFEWMNKNLFYGAFKRIDSFFPNSELAAKGMPAGEELEILQKHQSDLPAEVFGTAYIPPRTNGSGPPGLRQNLRKATKLLKEAGWQIKEEVLTHKETGQPFSFEILLGDPNDEKIALQFSRALKRLGIEAKVRTVDSAQFMQRLDGFDYDMVVFRWINSLSPGNEQVNYWGSQAAVLNGSRNYAGVQNPAIDTLAESIAAAPTRTSLVARTHALDRALTWGHYTIPLYYLGKDFVAYAKNLRRPDKTPVYGIVIETWWSEPSEKM